MFGLSLYRIELGKDDMIRFIGLNNYFVRLPIDKEIIESIPRTLFFAAITTAVTLPLALITALVLNRTFRGQGLLFLAVLMPWAIASVVAGVFFQFIFDTHFGIVNGILITVGLIQEPINWLQDTTQAVIIAIIAQAWRSAPLLAILMLAALRTIPDTLYRAAKMDGATAWESFRFVTLPGIKSTLIVVGILQIIVGLQVFDLLYSLTNGGPGRATYVLIYAIYNLAFRDVSLGYASAITVILFFIIVLASMLLLLFQVRRRRQIGPAEDEDVELAAAMRNSARLDRSAAAFAEQTRSASARRGAAAETPAVQAPARRRQGPVRRRVSRRCSFFFLAPIAWIAIASIQTEDALKSMPPAALTGPLARRLRPPDQRAELAGLVLREPLDGGADGDPYDRDRGAGRLLAGPLQPAGQAHDPGGPDLPADAPGHRHGDPGAADLPDPRAEGHDRLAGDRERRVLDSR